MKSPRAQGISHGQGVRGQKGVATDVSGDVNNIDGPVTYSPTSKHSFES